MLEEHCGLLRYPKRAVFHIFSMKKFNLPQDHDNERLETVVTVFQEVVLGKSICVFEILRIYIEVLFIFVAAILDFALL